MDLEKLAQVLLYGVHIPLGVFSLLSGAVALLSKKGSRLHKKSGIIFFYSMLISALSSLIIAVLPNHVSPFLFSVGLFSSYFLISGYRSLKFKRINDVNLHIDKLNSIVLIITSIGMIFYYVITHQEIKPVLVVFGMVGILFGVRDLILFRNPNQLQKNWLKLHLGKMTGGYIAAVSAFFVVNQILPNLWNWFAPGIVGGVYISYWMRKLK